MNTPDFLNPTDTFILRHLGPTEADLREMLATARVPSLEALGDAVVPSDIRLRRELNLPRHRGEQAVRQQLRAIGGENRVHRALRVRGYRDCIAPAVIQRNILENPGGYAQYTP